MIKLKVKSKENKQVIDITEIIENEISKKNLKNGICLVFIKHTTASITTADLDPGTDLDLLDAIEEIIPKLNYRHPHDPKHTGDHIGSSIIGSSVNLPYNKGKLILGTWQRVVLVELNGPRERQIILNFVQ